MSWYLLKRLLRAIPLLSGIVTVTYFMMQLDSKVWSMDRARRSGTTPKARNSRKGDRS